MRRETIAAAAMLLLLAGVAHADEQSASADADFDALMALPAEADEEGDPAEESAGAFDYGVASVHVPLSVFERLSSALRATTAPAAPLRPAPAVVLGEADYQGHVIHDGPERALAFTLRLSVTLGGGDAWKTVPLVGDDVVLAHAAVNGRAIGVVSAHGYQVWVTRQTGEVVIDMELLVPPPRPRGSSEYEFRVVRTPVTHFACRFPGVALEPHLDSAVQSTVTTQGGDTVLESVLSPTTRLHIVGFHDLGQARDARARIYAETLSLLSVDETAIEVFSIVRYRILYAGAHEFSIELPPGVKVVSADGRGGFRYEIEDRGSTRVLRGETEFPIRDNYEISVRLERDLGAGVQTSFDVPLPRALGVERESGWLAVEVPGKAELEEVSRAGPSSIDARQLPPELVQSAVGPILRAYRYHDAGARTVVLHTTRLPEQETAAESVDRVRAFSVVSAEGKVLTEMRVTLKNRLRPSLALVLPADASLRSSLLDGRPVKPSRNPSGELVLPLDRSRRVGEQLEPVTLQLVFEDHVQALDHFGRPELRLPALDLPVSSLAWSVFLPAGNIYSGLAGDVGAQSYAGQAHWSQAPADLGEAAGPAGGASEAADGREDSVHTGAMPVRIELPKGGIRLEHARYWLAAGQPATVSFRYADRWLAYPSALLLALLVLAGAAVGARSSLAARHLAVRLVTWVVAGAGAWLLGQLAGGRVALIAIGAGILIALPPRRVRALAVSAREWARTLPERFRADRERLAAEARALHELEAQLSAETTGHDGRARRRRVATIMVRAGARMALAACFVGAALLLVHQAMALVLQLWHPIGS